jgi:hypothetical protein
MKYLVIAFAAAGFLIAWYRKERTGGLDEVQIASIRDEDASFVTQLDGMITSNYVHLPTINGYSSDCPYGFDGFFREPKQESLDVWLEINNLDSSEVLIIQR